MSRLGDEDASIFDEPCINCSRPSTDNTFDPKKLQQAQKTDLQIYADKLKKGTIVYKDYKPIPLAEQEKLLAEELETNKGQKAPTVVPIYYYHPDHLGTSTALTDFNGSTYQFFLNLPFGETMAQQLGNNYYNSPYKFNGKELDEETGLYYYGARYYDPRTSTWLSVDPLAEKYQNVNPYVYTIDNPINLIDPDGKESTKPPLWKRVKDDFRYDLNQVKNNIKYALIKLDKMIESIPTEKNDKLQGNSQGHFKEGLNYIKSDANDPKNKRGLETANSAKNVDNADADFFDLFEGGIKMSSTSKAFEKVINTVDKVVAAKEKIQEGKENNASEYVQTVKDTKNPNNNRWVKKDFLDSQKKNKNEN